MNKERRMMIIYRIAILKVSLALECVTIMTIFGCGPQPAKTLSQVCARLGAESKAAYEGSPFSELSRDYFSRFSRDSQEKPATGEVMIDPQWKIVLSSQATPLAGLMAGDFAEFMERCMGVKLEIQKLPHEKMTHPSVPAVVLLDNGGGTTDVAESFTITVKPDQVIVAGLDAAGLRDGVVKLVEIIGLRQAPILIEGEQVYRPRLAVRLGTTPWLGTHRDLVFMGFNAVMLGGSDFYSLSVSDAIAELAKRRNPPGLVNLARKGKEARRYGLKTYIILTTRKKFRKDDPVFQKHPDIRGALTWKADGEYILCTEHPLVKKFFTETVEGIFRAVPDLDGVQIIIGGEGFYHCFMRPYGVQKGHTNCKRCEPLGPDKAVSNLCNMLAAAARKVNPKADISVWPYSAVHVWSADAEQSGLIKLLKPGTSLFTEIEKDEYVLKPGGIRKHLWDYSIDLIGPGPRAKKQIELCKAAGIGVHLKSEPEISLEAVGVPHIPCMDRWLDRAEALASCGADGAWVFPAFKPCYGTSAAEVSKLVWWTPAAPKEELLQSFAARIAGKQAGPHLRKAWGYVSKAMELTPMIPSYYKGPYYLGPAHPMCADLSAKLPKVFYGQFLFRGEATDEEGLKLRPTFDTSPLGAGDADVLMDYYRRMEKLLKKAVDEVDAARPLVQKRHNLMFEAECSPMRWMYHTARTEANFRESCQIRDRLFALAKQEAQSPQELAKARKDYKRWREILLDEKENAQAALGVMEADVRLDFYYGGDHTFSHGSDMIRAKIKIIDEEINDFLPSFAKKLNLDR